MDSAKIHSIYNNIVNHMLFMALNYFNLYKTHMYTELS